MKKRTFPCQCYVLTSNCNVRKITIARPYSTSYETGSGYTARGVYYRHSELFDTKAAAIKAGRAQIKRRRKNLEAALETLQKNLETLDKAEAKQ